MKKMFVEVKIDIQNRNITNHAGKETCTALYNAGFTDKSVMSRSGHRSNAVQIYQRESGEMLKNVSDVRVTATQTLL